MYVNFLNVSNPCLIVGFEGINNLVWFYQLFEGFCHTL